MCRPPPFILVLSFIQSVYPLIHVDLLLMFRVEMFLFPMMSLLVWGAFPGPPRGIVVGTYETT